jgi:adenylate kinase
MRVVFLGPPGVGKGTQAVRLAQSRGVPHVSTGDILRDAVKNGTPVGVRARSFMDHGKLVPDEVVIGIIEERFRTMGLEKGFALDGFPRTVPQAEALAALLSRLQASLDRVLYFDAPDDVIVERLSGRRTCRGCGSIYHVKFMPARSAEICDKCGGPLYQRPDDEEKAIRERLRVYKAQTSELIRYYGDRKLLRRIESSRSPEEIARDVDRIVAGAG